MSIPCRPAFVSVLGIFLLSFCRTALGQEPQSPVVKPKTELPENKSSTPMKPPDTKEVPIRISWVGDIVMEVPWREQPVAPKALFAGVREELKTADLVIANLETPLTDWTEQTPHKNKADIDAGRDVVLRVGSPEAAPALADAGIKVVGLANNHTMDYTERGLLDTLQRLRSAGVLYAGGGANLVEAENALILKTKGKQIGILSFSDVVPRYSWAEADRPGIATAKEADRVVDALHRTRPKVDILIMVFHWGTQFAQEPTPRQEFLAKAAQQAGADLVLGAHPHVLQGVGCTDHVPVVYSAGNFVFPTMSIPTRRTAIFEFEFSGGQPASLRLVPVLLDEHGAPQLADSETRQDILAEIGKLSGPLGLQITGDVGLCKEMPVPAPDAQSKTTPAP